MSDARTRSALVKSDLGNEAEANRLLQTVRRFLPSNYTAHAEFWMKWEIVITGEDRAGWTLDDYVIPRLASGLYWAEEIELPE
jgi:hypothetical protein